MVETAHGTPDVVGADQGGMDRVASHPASLILLCNVVQETSTIVNQPLPLHQYSLLWVSTPSATFYAKFLDQCLWGQ